LAESQPERFAHPALFASIKVPPGTASVVADPGSDDSFHKMGIKNTQWFCAQIGAREHYAIPQVLHQRGKLGALYTDFWAGTFTRKTAQVTQLNLARSLATRFNAELSSAPIIAWNIRSVLNELASRRYQGSSGEVGLYHRFLKTGQQFATHVRENLRRRNDLDAKSIYFGYDTGALETMEWCRSQKIRCIVNQMDPSRIESELVREEEALWPDWKLPTAPVPEAYFQRRIQEWALADRVVVNSNFCGEALKKQGVPAEKLTVVPLCYEAGNYLPERMKVGDTNRPLRVLFLGQVILRKGIQYLCKVARQLQKEKIHFDVVGPIGISDSAIKSAPANVAFHGRATRDQTAAWYQRSDVFVLPTLSDGFALTQLEAMAHGLPVVTTPCCGEVVTNGVDGFIVPARDVGALVQAFQNYLLEPERLKTHQTAALQKSRQFTLARLAENLMQLESKLK